MPGPKLNCAYDRVCFVHMLSFSSRTESIRLCSILSIPRLSTLDRTASRRVRVMPRCQRPYASTFDHLANTPTLSSDSTPDQNNASFCFMTTVGPVGFAPILEPPDRGQGLMIQNANRLSEGRGGEFDRHHRRHVCLPIRDAQLPRCVRNGGFVVVLLPGSHPRHIARPATSHPDAVHIRTHGTD